MEKLSQRPLHRYVTLGFQLDLLLTLLVAFAGLTYLSLFLAAKLFTVIPFLSPTPREILSIETHSESRKEAAAPPLYLLVIVLIPIGAAIYIASTRFTDNKHAGFDILFGSVEGIICAWFAFRLYHLPIRRGAGWAWGPRHRHAAFGFGTGIGSYTLQSGKQKRQRYTESNFAHGGNIELNRMPSPAGPSGRSYESQNPLV